MTDTATIDRSAAAEAAYSAETAAEFKWRADVIARARAALLERRGRLAAEAARARDHDVERLVVLDEMIVGVDARLAELDHAAERRASYLARNRRA
jgi:hypothetical protein